MFIFSFLPILPLFENYTIQRLDFALSPLRETGCSLVTIRASLVVSKVAVSPSYAWHTALYSCQSGLGGTLRGWLLT